MAELEEESHPFEAAPRARAKVFMHGGSQAVRLPKAFRFEGEEVEVHREGDRVVLTPVRNRWPVTEAERVAFWARIDALRGDQMLSLPPRDDDFFRSDPDMPGDG